MTNKLEKVRNFSYIALASFLEIVDCIAITFVRPVRRKSNRKKLLVLQLDAVGDFILFLDSFKEYRELYPQTKWNITLLGNRLWADLATNLPYADRYRFIGRKEFFRNPLYRYRVLKEIRLECFDAVIQSTISRQYSFGDAVLRASGAQDRLGSFGDTTNMTARQKRKSDMCYTRLVPTSGGQLPELERNAEFLRGLGLRKFQASIPVYPLRFLGGALQKAPFNNGAPYFIIFPGAAWVGRQWPERYFAAVAKSLYKETGWRPVICGGPGEEPTAKRVAAAALAYPWLDIAGKTSLSQLIRIIGSARLLISNETSAVHMASAVGCPVVCIMGGGHFGRFFPYGDQAKNRIAYKKMDCYHCNWHCIYPTVRCMEEVKVSTVWQEICSILEVEHNSIQKK